MEAYVASVLAFAGLYALLALGLNLQWGHTGLVNLGHVAFFAIGAYTAALMSLAGAWIPVGIVLGGVFAAAAAYPLGRLTLRLQEDYLAIVTLGFAEVLRQILSSEQWSGSTNGLPGVPLLFGQFGALGRQIAFVAVVGALLGVAFVLVRRIADSPYGRVLRAIRADEGAVRALGKAPERYRLASLMIGSGLAGLAGGLYAHYIGFVVPDQFVPALIFVIWTGVILGGSSIAGSLLGMLAFVLLLESTRFLSVFGLGPLETSQVRLLIVGVTLILVMLFRPQGFLPYRYRTRAQ